MATQNGKMSDQELLQTLAQRTMQNVNPALNQYNNYHRQSQFGMNDNMDSEPSDLDGTNLYIKGLWKDCTQVELDDLFKKFGVISQSRVYGDGVGFVRFEQPHEARRVESF